MSAELICPLCHHKFEGAVSAIPGKEEPPVPGSIAICTNCAELLEFTEEAPGGLRECRLATLMQFTPQLRDYIGNIASVMRAVNIECEQGKHGAK